MIFDELAARYPDNTYLQLPTVRPSGQEAAQTARIRPVRPSDRRAGVTTTLRLVEPYRGRHRLEGG